MKKIGVFVLLTFLIFVFCNKNPFDNANVAPFMDQILFNQNPDPTEYKDLCTINPDGSEKRIVSHYVHDPDKYIQEYIHYACWSPDRAKILIRGGPCSSLEYKPLWLMDNHGNYIQPISPAGTNPVWCHDGEHILFQGGYTYVLSIDIYGNNEKVVYKSADSLKFIFSDVSQSGEWLLGSEFMVYENEEGKSADTDLEIVKINIKTGEKKYLTDNDKGDGAPKFSPDGSMIAFTREYNEKHVAGYGTDNIYIMSIDGSNVRRITDFSDINTIYPSKAWSPDGEKIAFHYASRYTNPSDIFIVDIDTGELFRLTHSAKDDIDSRVMDWK